MSNKHLDDSPIEISLDGFKDTPSIYDYSFFKNLEHRILWLDTDINSETVLSVIKFIEFFNIQDKGKSQEERRPIILKIYSYGGEVDACFALCSCIETSITPVYTVNMGTAMSAALVIFLSGKKKFTTKYSSVLIHSGSGGTQGSFEAAQAQMCDYQHTIKMVREFILNHTKIEKKLFEKKKSQEWYIYDEEQVTLGIADKIIDSIDDII